MRGRGLDNARWRKEEEERFTGWPRWEIGLGSASKRKGLEEAICTVKNVNPTDGIKW